MFLVVRFFRKIIRKDIPNMVSIVIAMKIEEFTVPIMFSNKPVQAKPIIVIPVERQINCRAIE
jgi:hypothetical protein